MFLIHSATSRRSHPSLWRLALAGLCLIGAATLGLAATGQTPPKPWKAPSRASRKANPVAVNAQSLNLGKMMFKRECASCHGDTGHGDGAAGRDLNPRPTDLITAKVLSQSDGALYWKITKGRSPMPAFKALLDEQQRWSVINYMRSIAPPKSQSEDEAQAPVDPASGGILAGVSDVLAVWMQTGRPLSSGEIHGVRAQSAGLPGASKTLDNADATTFSAKAADVWESYIRMFADAANAFMHNMDSIDMARASFADATEALVSIVEHVGHAEPTSVSVFAVTAGVTTRAWLQTVTPIIKPFGVLGIEYHPAATIAPSRHQ